MSLKNVRSVIAISSCKGGVGKSTVAAMLAQDLANRGFRVGLLDADIYGPSMPTMFGIHQPEMYGNEQKQFIPLQLRNGLKLMSFGFLLGQQPAVMRGPIVSNYVQQLLRNVAWGELDYLFIDMPPGTGDVQITITQQTRLTGAVIVTTPHTLSVVDVARGILMFEKMNVPILGVIENMAYFVAPDGQRHHVFGERSIEQLHAQFGVPVLGELPIRKDLAGDFVDFNADDTLQGLNDKVVRQIGQAAAQKNNVPAIDFDDAVISLTWPDGKNITVPNRQLRLNSKDALSYNELTGEKMFHDDDIPQDVHAKEVHTLGNYAIGVHWSDGHTAAIYPYKMIEALVQDVKK